MCSEPGQPGRPLPRPYFSQGPNEQGEEETEEGETLNKTKSDIYVAHPPMEPFHPSNLARRRAVRVDGEGLDDRAPDWGCQLT